MKKLLYILTIFLISCSSMKNLKEPIISSKTQDTTISDTTNIHTNRIENISMCASPTYSNKEIDEEYIVTTKKIRKKPIVKEKIIFDNKFNNKKRKNIGHVTYNVPETMLVGQHYKITLRITKKNFSDTLIIDINKNKNVSTTTTISNIDIANAMESVLIDAENTFTIKELSSPKQKIVGDYNEWSWDVIPNEKGFNNIKSVVKIVYTDEDGIVKDFTVFEKDIYTKMNLSYKINTFLVSYWQWIITTFLLPLLVYFWNKKRNSKEN